MSGFNELIPQELINVFDERELEVGTGLYYLDHGVDIIASC